MNKGIFPMNLQFFADEQTQPQQITEPQTSEEQKNEQVSEPKTDEQKNVPTVQELMVELAKLKRAQEKAASEASEYKKKYRESLSEQERASQEKAEAQAAHDEEFELLKKTVRVNELTENFMDLGYDKNLAKQAANAQADGDTETLLTIQKQFNEMQQKKWEADFYKKMPAINTGTSGNDAITKEQFDKMTLVEKSKLRRENKAEYDRLIAL